MDGCLATLSMVRADIRSMSACILVQFVLATGAAACEDGDGAEGFKDWAVMGWREAWAVETRSNMLAVLSG